MMNKLIKGWQERKKLDCVTFAEEFEDHISQQRRKKGRRKVEEKAELILFLNVVVDEKCYRSILNYTPGKQSIERARNNVATSSIYQLQLNPFMLVYVMIVPQMNKSTCSFKMKRKMTHPARKQK